MGAATIQCWVNCVNPNASPRYRLWVNHELFMERTWRWGQDHYLEETVTISGKSGQYHIRYETVPGDVGQFVTSNWQTIAGPAVIIQPGLVEIA